MRSLIEKGANIELGDKDQWRALHHASTADNTAEVIEYLISKGAEVNAKNIRGETPLDIVGSEESQKVLLDNGGKESTAWTCIRWTL